MLDFLNWIRWLIQSRTHSYDMPAVDLTAKQRSKISGCEWIPNSNWEIVKLYFDGNKLLLDWMIYNLYLTNTLRCVGFFDTSSLNQQSTDKHVTLNGHIFLIPRKLVLLLNAVCLVGRHKIPISLSLVWLNRRSTAHKARTLIIEPPMSFQWKHLLNKRCFKITIMCCKRLES